MENVFRCVGCDGCPFYDFEIGWCQIYKKRTWQSHEDKPTWCTIIEVTIKRSD